MCTGLLSTQVGVANPSQPPSHVVPESFQGGRHNDAVLEAVATTTTTDELLLDGREGDSGVLVEQHVDVVEGEGAQVCLVQLFKR